MPEELKPLVPVVVGLAVFFLVLYFFASVFGWFWTHPAATAAVAALCVWLGFLAARRARV